MQTGTAWSIAQMGSTPQSRGKVDRQVHSTGTRDPAEPPASDQLFGGRPIRILAVIDAHTREALSIVPRASFRAFDLVQELDGLARGQDRPKTLKVDNGPEFADRLLDQWAYLNGVEIDFSRPVKPTDDARTEAFNSRLREECLNASWFLSTAAARDRLGAWRREYNDERPHGSLRTTTSPASRCWLGTEPAVSPPRSTMQQASGPSPSQSPMQPATATLTWSRRT